MQIKIFNIDFIEILFTCLHCLLTNVKICICLRIKNLLQKIRKKFFYFKLNLYLCNIKIKAIA